MSQLSQTLSTLRKKNNLTQEEFGAKLGVSAQSVSKWENSISMPDICLLPMIAETLGVSIDELFGIENPSFRKTTDDFPEEIHKKIFKDIASWFDETDSSNVLKKYDDEKLKDAASVVFTRKGAVFENNGIGIVFPQSPEEALKLLKDEGAMSFLLLLSDSSVLTTLHYLAKTKQFATVALLSSRCGMPQEEVHTALTKLQTYQLVNHQTINLEDEALEVWRIQRSHVILFVCAIMEIARHASKLNDRYFCYRGDSSWCY